MEFVILWIACGFITAWIAGSKRDSVGAGFCLGCFMGPIGILLALVCPGPGKTCQFCRELINKHASVCPRCQRDQPRA